MAEFDRWIISITTMDGVLRPSTSNFYTTQALAQDYVAASDAAGRAATDIGGFISKYLAMTDSAFVNSQVGIMVINDPVSNPADTVLRGNKLAFKSRSGGRGLDFTIPARKAASYTQSTDSLQVSITTPTAMANFVDAYNSVVTDMFEHAATVLEAEVVD